MIGLFGCLNITKLFSYFLYYGCWWEPPQEKLPDTQQNTPAIWFDWSMQSFYKDRSCILRLSCLIIHDFELQNVLSEIFALKCSDMIHWCKTLIDRNFNALSILIFLKMEKKD